MEIHAETLDNTYELALYKPLLCAQLLKEYSRLDKFCGIKIMEVNGASQYSLFQNYSHHN